MTQASLISTTLAHLNAHGNAFWGKFRNPEGVVEQLAALDPTTITVRVRGGEPRYTRMIGSACRSTAARTSCTSGR